MSSPSPDEKPHRGRWTLVGIFLLFFVPMVFAWLLNIERPSWLPSAQTNHGSLIRPPQIFPVADLRAIDSRPVPAGLMQGKWTLVYIEQTHCLADCDRAIYRTRQVRHALGKDMQRVQRVLVAGSENIRTTVDKVHEYDGGIAIVAADPEWFWRASFVQQDVEIYLVDPQGYLVLSYARKMDPSGIISDLKRLLKISKIG